MNPFDLYPARAYSNPDAFCSRPDLSALLARAAAGRLWTLIAGERRMGKSSAIIADCVRARRRILHVDLVGVTATEDINERFRWAWTVFRQQEASGIFGGLTAELAASIPVTGVEMKLTGQHAETPQNWGDVIMAFDKRAKKSGGLLFLDEFQDLSHLADKGQKATRSLRAALQMAKHTALVLAGSSQHLLSLFFAPRPPLFSKASACNINSEPWPRINSFSGPAIILNSSSFIRPRPLGARGQPRRRDKPGWRFPSGKEITYGSAHASCPQPDSRAYHKP